jgi:vitamin B12/bleomycin/antimicrobial peptide transport system ATP-binding/permease protein
LATVTQEPRQRTAPNPGGEIQGGLIPQVALVLRALHTSPVGRFILWIVVGIVLVIVVTAYGQIRLNAWNKNFFDALARRDMGGFLFQLGVFFIIAGALLVLNVGQRWLVDTLKLRLREALVQDLVGRWMEPRRAFWLAHAGPMGVNPDQRMHDDARNLCDMSTDLGVGLFQATVLFVSFAGILFMLSKDFSIQVGGIDYPIPGFMLWAAILYAALGSLASYWVGRSLVGRNADRYAREAELRFSLVRINEHLDGISLASGEADEKRRVNVYLYELLTAMRRVVWGHTNLTWVTAGFGWIMGVAPILVAAPLFYQGKITFGGLMMAAAAFTQAQSSLRWFVDNFSMITDWRATLLRVAGFRQALTAGDAPREAERQIRYEDGAPGELVVENLAIESPTGRDRLREERLVVRPGERLLIVGAPGTATTTLFRALAGLWPWGSGRIVRPTAEPILYVPRGTPYLPRGTLREVLAYPQAVGAFEADAFARALRRLGLDRLVPMLDAAPRWDRELSHDEQLDLAFARLVLQVPPWIVIDDAFGALDDEAFHRLIDVFGKELKGSGVLHIGRAVEERDPLFSRVLHLEKADGTTALDREKAAQAQADKP